MRPILKETAVFLGLLVLANFMVIGSMFANTLLTTGAFLGPCEYCEQMHRRHELEEVFRDNAIRSRIAQADTIPMPED